MDDVAGYVLLYRKITDNAIWTTLEPSVLKVMLGFLLKANWKPKAWYDGRAHIEIPRGAFVTSYRKMAAFCRLSLKQTRTAFAHLETLNFASYSRGTERAHHTAQVAAHSGARSGTHQWTMVTVLNYESYQSALNDAGTENGTVKGRVVGTQGVAEGAPTKEIRSKRVNTCSPDGELFSVDNPQADERPAPAAWGPTEKERAFQEFWEIWPRKRSKAEAEKIFCRHTASGEGADHIIQAVRAQLRQLTADLQFCPYPTTWLNQRRYEDETEEIRGSANDSGSSYSPAEDDE
jgi:hypothetical protein